MKRLLALTLTSLFTLVLCTAGSAYAQSTAVIRVRVPFEFSVGNRTFQPGEYSLVQPLQNFLVLRNDRGQTIASTFTIGVQLSSAPSISTLTFRDIGGQHVLSEVWQQDTTSGHKLLDVPANHPNYAAHHRSPEARQTAEGSQP